MSASVRAYSCGKHLNFVATGHIKISVEQMNRNVLSQANSCFSKPVIYEQLPKEIQERDVPAKEKRR